MSIETEKWILLFPADDLGDDEARCVDIDGRKIAIYKSNGNFYASDDRCPHGNASLSEGWLEDGVIECPLHQSLFELETGKVLSPPCKVDVQVYELKIENNKLHILLN